jgi:hypothetical protein
MEAQEKPKMTFREVGTGEDQSAAEREAALLKQHEEETAAKEAAEAAAANPPANEEKPKVEISEEAVLSFIKDKYNKEVPTIEELLKEKIVQEQLPEDVDKFLKFKKETGRGIDDFVKAQTDYTQLPEETVIKEYLKLTEEGLEQDDIEELYSSEFSYDEDLDDEKEISATKRKVKKTLAEAYKFFNERKEKYSAPLESKAAEIPNEELEQYNAFKERIAAAKDEEEVGRKLSQHFAEKTNQLFSNEFKGFKFTVNEKEVIVPFGDPSELKEKQSSISNFIGKFLDSETGVLKDPEGYHKSLAAAMNPEKLASFFYELGKAEAIEATDKEQKNINMSQRSMRTTPSIKGVKYREIPSKD